VIAVQDLKSIDRADVAVFDAEMMRRCLELSKRSGDCGEYPYAVVICCAGEFVCESINRVRSDRDVTRHAEVVALAEAQRRLARTSLDDCTLYSIAEPCASCSYAIRETRIGRVVYGLQSPVMGGHSRWNILADNSLSASMPEVFAAPPEIVRGYMQEQAEQVFRQWNPLAWRFIRSRGLFVTTKSHAQIVHRRRNGLLAQLMRFLRRALFDRIGRR
jgi:tRNA(adenine34) deaminase